LYELNITTAVLTKKAAAVFSLADKTNSVAFSPQANYTD
jgi:hypothetical protein